jgi:transcriptional regulator NrdR family protein
MTNERRNEISYLALKEKLKREGIHLANIRRNLANEAKNIGVSRKELEEFAKNIISELLQEAFKSKVEA